MLPSTFALELPVVVTVESGNDTLTLTHLNTSSTYACAGGLKTVFQFTKDYPLETNITCDVATCNFANTSVQLAGNQSGLCSADIDRMVDYWNNQFIPKDHELSELRQFANNLSVNLDNMENRISLKDTVIANKDTQIRRLEGDVFTYQLIVGVLLIALAFFGFLSSGKLQGMFSKNRRYH